MMIILPAIDLLDGKVVRLAQGKRDQVTVYSDDPVGMARRWKDQGAQWLHVVDLNGALDGTYINLPLAERIIKEVGLQVELSGGIRSKETLSRALAAGAARVILGTKACSSPGELGPLAKRFGDKLAVGIDALNGLVQVKGWVETTSVKAVELAKQLDSLGVKTIIYTDTATDGTMGGVNAAQVAGVCKAVSCDVVASGGIASAEDIRKLAGLSLPNLVGAIVGKALYEKTVTLKELAEVSR